MIENLICNYPWLPWLLSGLLGLIVGYLIWAKWKKMYADMEAKVKGLHTTITGLEADLAACRKARTETESDLALTKGRMRELESEYSDYKIKYNDQKNDTPDLGRVVSGFVAGNTVDNSDSSDTSNNSSSNENSIYAGIKSDNLQIIEGIGPKMESILKENGVNTHAELAAKSTSDIQTILNKYGDKYKIIDPKTWSQQAGLASSGMWTELIDLQKRLDTGRDNAKNMTDSKLEKVLIRSGAIRRFKQDDLKAIEGIGPAIEKLMHAADIKTWRGMANTSVEKLQSILSDAGPRFKLADPGTWPQQAEYAADGKFKELQEYQDFLQGGK